MNARVCDCFSDIFGGIERTSLETLQVEAISGHKVFLAEILWDNAISWGVYFHILLRVVRRLLSDRIFLWRHRSHLCDEVSTVDEMHKARVQWRARKSGGGSGICNL
jgi:hypothetical protein